MSERDHVFERDMGVITLLLERLRDEQGIDYVLLSRGKYEGLADRVTELEAELAKQKQVVILLAFECAKIHGGSIPEWIRVTEDGVDSPQGQELLASIRQAREQIANAREEAAAQAEGLKAELAVRDQALLHLCSRIYDMDGTVPSNSFFGFRVEEFMGVPIDGKTDLCYVEVMRDHLIDIAREQIANAPQDAPQPEGDDSGE